MNCGHCQHWPSGIGAFRAAFVFRGPIREAIHRFKYQGEFARAPSLSKLMLDALMRPEFTGAFPWDLVSFVPLHRRRRRQRGFDQSELISVRLADELGLSCIKNLARVVDTPSQVGRGEAERRSNVRNAFAWTGERIEGARVLLIDDVVTTGATMLSAGQTLLDAGALRVDGFTLARELRD